MTQFNKISDEELAAYLEGILSDKESDMINAAMDIDTLEILNVSHQVMDKFPSDNGISLPSWENIPTASIHPMYEPMAMAGFLGESNAEDVHGDIYDENKDE